LITLNIEDGVRVAEEAVQPLVDKGEGVEDDGDHHHEEHLTEQRVLQLGLHKLIMLLGCLLQDDISYLHRTVNNLEDDI